MRLGSFLVLLHQSTTDGTAMASTGVAVNVDKIRYSHFNAEQGDGIETYMGKTIVVSYRIPPVGSKTPSSTFLMSKMF